MAEAERIPSFLDEDEQQEARIAMADQALEFARQHLFFVQDPRAAALLQMWRNDVATKRIPPGSPIDAYARAEAVREFIAVIDRQINIAMTGKLA